MRKIILALLVGLAPCALVFAAESGKGQEKGHAPGIVKTESQIKSELDRSTSKLGIVAGQVTSIVEAGGWPHRCQTQAGRPEQRERA